MPNRPLPMRDIWDPVTAPFWLGANRHRLLVQQCLGCQRWLHPPAAGCPYCGGVSFGWTDLGGAPTGSVHTFTVCHRAFGTDLDVPYVVVLVDLDLTPGVRVVGNLVGSDVDRVRIGLPVILRWEDHPDSGVSLPQWQAISVDSDR